MNNIFFYLFLIVSISLGGYTVLLRIENADLNTEIQKLNTEIVTQKAQGTLYEKDIRNLKKTIYNNNSLIDSMKIERDKLNNIIKTWKQKAIDEKLTNRKLKDIINKYSDVNATGDACLRYNREISKLNYKDL